VNKDLLADVVTKALPEGFLAALASRMEKLYSQTYDEAFRRFPGPEAKYWLPHLRRAEVEATLDRLASDFGVQAIATLNRARNYYHREVVVGPLVLTASAVGNASDMVRSAKFRATLAEESQLCFPGLEDPRLANGMSLYGILLHGPSSANPKELGFLHIGFPSAHCDEWVANIDLSHMHSIQSQTEIDAQEELIEDDIMPTVRPDVVVPGKMTDRKDGE
jgi:hypothetical protein